MGQGEDAVQQAQSGSREVPPVPGAGFLPQTRPHCLHLSDGEGTAMAINLGVYRSRSASHLRVCWAALLRSWEPENVHGTDIS